MLDNRNNYHYNQIDNYMDLLIYRNSNEDVCNSLGLFYSGFEPLGRQEGGIAIYRL